MYNYKAEIENILMDIEENSKKYGFTPSVNKILSLFREIVKEATKIEPPSYNGEGMTVRYDERNKTKKEILSNIEKVI